MISTSKGWERWGEVGKMALGDGLWEDDRGDGMATTGQGAESSPEIQSPTMSIILN